ncbi:MAG TPA: neuraminidase-like domain-containing protein [Actinomycetota bacterium]|nr:neuraminidase-like domain-containing protein [Actinomycetota bacterium]
MDQTPHGGSSDVVAYPTLEQLFGSMDYCSCDHCRSILSPAAYLVDLLRFLDHNPPDNKTKNPQAVLFGRRPDINYLKLSCENTNTPMPYIDVVNETLEYFVSHANINSPPSLSNFVGHDTDATVDPAELLASPQFVDETAYETLLTAIFPAPLPFNKSLETLRRYFKKLGTPLCAAMETLRADDAVERTTEEYAWRDILMERLGFSREEYQLLIDKTLTVRHLYGYDDNDSNASVPPELPNLETFTRRMGLSYDDLVAILKTRFVNPSSSLITRIELLGAPFTALRDLHTGALASVNFGKLLPRKLDPAVYGGDPGKILPDGSNYDQVMGDTIKTWLAAGTTYDEIMALITISNPKESTNLCAVDALELRYANPDTSANLLGAIDYVRMARFVRLWRKLGWSVALTDSAITSLSPPDPSDGKPPLDHLDAAWKVLLPRLGIVRALLDRLNLEVERDLPGQLACWAPVETHGDESLYRRMFQSTTILQQDSAFAANAFGDVLQDATLHVSDHLEALRAAFGLTSEEVALIVDQVVADANAAVPPPNPLLTKQTLPLSLANISAIYRYGWLAHELQLSVVELLLLKKRTGYDVFAAPDPVNPPIVLFLDVVQRLEQAALRPTQALYLIWDDDISGKSAPDRRQLTDLARTLRADFAAVEGDFAIIDDPNGDIARARMTLVYGADATNFFFGLLDNTFVVNAKFASSPTSSPQPLISAAPGRVVYDDFAKQLTFAGYLDATTDTGLKTAAGTDANLKQAVADLETAANAALAPYLARFPKWKGWLDAYATAPATDSPEKKRAALLANILPELKHLRKREQALAAISAVASTDLGLTTALLDDAGALNSAATTNLTGLDDFTAFDVGSSAPITAAFDGFIDPPQNALYDFAVDADPGIMGVTLLVDGVDAAMAGGPKTWTNAAPIKLTAGGLASFTLTITGTGAVKVRWIAQGQSWSEIPADCLYTADSIDHARTTYTRLLKTNALASGLQLAADEVVYFAKRSDLEINFPTSGLRPWLNALPVGTDPSPFAIALRDHLITLLDFAALKAALSPSDERLLAIFEDPSRKAADGTLAVLTLPNWDVDSLTSLLKQFGKTNADLSDVATFRRVYRSFQLAKTLGISASALLAATTNNPDPASAPSSHTVRDFESALRARYDARAWLQVIQPINDALRVMCRDALVAYVLQTVRKQPGNTIDTPDKLFEYFLMDVQMEACMQTSRIRHALSSVQLFVERCLMNLEGNVSPALLDAKQWEWMRRYRVWEANRKVFLWPENWLEPELRDDQSSIFKETMAELLQSDITEDTAEVALLNYLAKLEEIAKLEPCGVYYVDDKNVYLVARTSGAHRKYFYRQMENGSWLPWEQIKLDIDDNPVIPYLWNGRLLLFWIKLLKRSPLLPNVPSKQDPKSWTADDLKQQTPLVTVGAVLCWSERYNGKWQPTKTSNPDRPAMFLSGDPAVIQLYAPGDEGTGSFNRAALRLGVTGEGDGLRFFVSDSPEGEGSTSNWTSFLFLNTHSLPDIQDDNSAPEYSNVNLGDISNGRLLDTSTDKTLLTISFEFFDQRGYDYGDPPSTEDVLQSLSPSATRTVEPLQSLGDWSIPFIYQDGRHVFYVRPTSAPIEIVVPSLPPFGPVQIARLVGNLVQRNTINGVIHRQAGDPVPVGARLSDDANINHILTGSRNITFDGTKIGVAGGIRSVSNR